MKKFSKKLLSLLLSVLLIAVSLPFTAIPAYADARGDLSEAITRFEGYVTDIANNGIDAIYTGMGDAYQVYLEGIFKYTNGSASEIVDVTERLNDAMDAMVKFEQATIDADYEAAHPVKIGTGTNQPLKSSEKTSAMGYGTTNMPSLNDYDNVIYSDGATASWAQALDTEFNYKYGYPSVDTYRNRVRIYYPNTVILYDGKTVPKIPIISAFQGYGTYSDNGALTADNYRTVVMENLYESTNDVELLNNYWLGTTCGNPFDTNYNYLYENVEWPETNRANLHGTSTDSFYYFSSSASEIDYNEAAAGNTTHLTDCTNKYQIFKNSLQYIPTESETRNFDAGYQEVLRTKWSGNSQIYFRFLGNAFVWNNVNSMKVATQDATAIYVVNYKYFLESLQSNLEKYEDDLTVENARDGDLGSILSALSVAAAFNPLDETKYPYSSATFAYTDVKGRASTGMEAAARKCGDDIDAVVDILGAADVDDVDAQYENLVEALEAYEEKMAQQKVYTDMAVAYETYCLGRKYADSYKYGNRDEFTPSLQTIAYNLEKQTKAMKAVGRNAYNYYPGQGFDGDLDSETKTDAYKAAYKNLVYASSAPARTRESGFPTTTSSPATSFTRKTDNTSVTDGVLGLYRYNATGTITATNYDSGSSTYLYVPNAVGVYDGVSGDINVPVLLGFRAAGGWTGIATNPIHYTLWSYSSETSALPFAYSYWKTRKYMAGDSATYDGEDNTDKMGDRTNAYSSRGMTFIETANLNQILNGSTIDASPNAISTNNSTAISGLYSNGYYSNARSDNKSEAPNPENFYANAIKLTKPTFTGDDWKKYMYEYTTITTKMRSNSIRQSSSGVSTSTASDNSNYISYGSYSGTISSLSMWVIDYSGVQAIIDENDDILTDSALEIKKYSEGNLLDYFKDMDKLTACSPVNAKYEYDNAKYTNTVPNSTYTGFSAATEQCAYDIWRLLEAGDEDEKVQYLDENGMKVDGEYINVKEDLKNEVNYVDGSYDELRDALELDPSSEVGPCIGNEGEVDYYQVYENAVAEGAQEMYNVSNYNSTDGTYEGYITDESDTSIHDTAQSIVNAYNDLLAHNEQTRHGYVYSGKENDTYENYTRVNYFQCGLVPTHDIHLNDADDVPYNYAEMELYENLAIAYDTLDPDKYNNDQIILDGKEAFDAATATAAELGEAEVKARQGMKAQDIIDQGVTALLTAINVNNGDAEGNDGLTTDKRVTRYKLKFVIENTSTGEEQDITSFIIDESDDSIEVDDEDNYLVPFGYQVQATARLTEDGEPVVCTGWEITSGDATSRRLDITTINLPYYVLDNTTIKAYYTPPKADDEIQVIIDSVFGYKLYKLNEKGSDVLEIAYDNLNEVKIGDTTYTVPNGLQQYITNWRVRGGAMLFGETPSENVSIPLSELATGSSIELSPVAPVQPVNGPWVIKLDNQPIEVTEDEPEGKSFTYDEIVTVTSDVDNCYAIAVNVDGQYIPVAYGNTYKFYANSDMTNFYSIVRTYNVNEIGSDGVPDYSYFVGDVDITSTYTEEQLFLLKGNMPMVHSASECTDEDNNSYTTRSQFTLNIGNSQFNNGLKITEVGTIYYIDRDQSYEGVDISDKLTLDNVGSSDFNVIKIRSSVLDFSNENFSNQYSRTLLNPHNRNVYTRAYVKYEYSFTNLAEGEENQSAVISAVYYGNICNAYNTEG